MTESAESTPRFTKRRVWLAISILVLLLAALGFALWDRGPALPLRITIAGFETNAEQAHFAVLTVTNTSRQEVLMTRINKESPLLHWYLRPFSRPGEVKHVLPPGSTPAFTHAVAAGRVSTNRVLLPQHGRDGPVGVLCWVDKPTDPRWLRELKNLCGIRSGTRWQAMWLISEEEIQCPLARPDGTIEPPRVLPKGALGRGRD